MTWLKKDRPDELVLTEKDDGLDGTRYQLVHDRCVKSEGGVGYDK